MLAAEFLRAKHAVALPYDRYVATAKPGERPNWDRVYTSTRLTEAQSALVRSFTRTMPVLVLSGTWCGDCVHQCPLLARIAGSAPPSPQAPSPQARLIDLRFLDRDAHRDLADRVMICAGHRVPTVIFMAEDFEFAGLFGDRTLSRYRAIAARQLGASCPLPGAPLPPEEHAAMLQEWLDEFERIHLLLRLSPRLRETHRD